MAGLVCVDASAHLFIHPTELDAEAETEVDAVPTAVPIMTVFVSKVNGGKMNWTFVLVVRRHVRVKGWEGATLPFTRQRAGVEVEGERGRKIGRAMKIAAMKEEGGEAGEAEGTAQGPWVRGSLPLRIEWRTWGIFLVSDLIGQVVWVGWHFQTMTSTFALA
jgi:hypothetical protein